MSYDLLKVTLEAELDALTEYRPQEGSEESLLLEEIDLSEFSDLDAFDGEYGLPRETHRCLTFRD